jgi:ferrous-iron efflux pump FieF
LRTRRSGPTRFIQLHLEMDDALPLVQAHQIADDLEQALLKRFPGADIIIHQDPVSAVPENQRGSFQR